MSRSRRLLSVSLLLCAAILFLTTPASAQVPIGDLGISVGGNYETLDDVSAGNTSLAFDKSAGFHAGVSYDQPLSDNLSVRPAFVVRRAGQYSFPGSLSGNGSALLESEEFELWMFEIPVDLRYRFSELGPASLYGLIGPQLSIPRAENDFEATMEDVSYSANVGLGVEFDLPAGLMLLPEVRYEYGITNAFKEEFTYRFQDFSVSDSPSVGALSLRVHLYLGP